MKSTIFSIVFALVIATVSAQQLTPCIAACAAPLIGATACSANDISCLCGDKVFFQAIAPCVIKCPQQDQQLAVTLCNGSSPISSISLVAGGSSATTTHPSTASPTHAAGNSTISTVSTKAHNSTIVVTSTGTNNFTRTSTTSATDGSSTSSGSDTATTTSSEGPSSTGSPSASASAGGATRLVGSGFMAAAMGVVFFVL